MSKFKSLFILGVVFITLFSVGNNMTEVLTRSIGVSNIYFGILGMYTHSHTGYDMLKTWIPGVIYTVSTSFTLSVLVYGI